MRAVRWALLMCVTPWVLASGCDDAKPKSHDTVETKGDEVSPDPTLASSTNGAASAKGETNGAKAPAADDGERLVVESSFLTIKWGDGTEVRYDFETGPGANWVWSANANQNMVTYTSKTKRPGDMNSFMLNMNVPGERLKLTKYGKGDPGEMAIMLNGDTDPRKGEHEVMAISGWVEAKRDAVSGAMIGKFEGVFHDEPTLKPLEIEPEHMGVEVKLSGTFAFQPPPREETPPVRVEKVMPNVP